MAGAPGGGRATGGTAGNGAGTAGTTGVGGCGSRPYCDDPSDGVGRECDTDCDCCSSFLACKADGLCHWAMCRQSDSFYASACVDDTDCCAGNACEGSCCGLVGTQCGTGRNCCDGKPCAVAPGDGVFRCQE